MADYLEKEKSGKFFSHDALVGEVKKLKQRSLHGVLEAMRMQEYHGIGAGQGLYTSEQPQFFPPKVKQLRRVRLFKRLLCTDGFWIEQADYQRTHDIESFCAGLEKAVLYNESTIPGQCQKPYWGQRSNNINEMYAKYVPPQFVEDQYELSRDGCSGRLSAQAMQFIHPRTLEIFEGEEAANKTQVDATVGAAAESETHIAKKYIHATHSPMILTACGGPGSHPLRKNNEIKALADTLGLESKQIKYGMKKLIGSRDLVA